MSTSFSNVPLFLYLNLKVLRPLYSYFKITCKLREPPFSSPPCDVMHPFSKPIFFGTFVICHICQILQANSFDSFRLFCKKFVRCSDPFTPPPYNPLRIARKYFKCDLRTEAEIIRLMTKYVHAVKEELRQFSRPLRGIGAVHFAFR